MSRFSVGQRVRIVWPTSIHLGKLATIHAIVRDAGFVNARDGSITREPILYRVKTDDGVDFTNTGLWLAYRPDQIEPIDDDSEIPSWEQVAKDTGWKPARVSA